MNQKYFDMIRDCPDIVNFHDIWEKQKEIRARTRGRRLKVRLIIRENSIRINQIFE